MERLGSLDAVFLAIEALGCPMSIGSVALFEGSPPSVEQVRTFVGAKLASVPRCRQRVRESWGLTRPVWVDDVHFDLADHVRGASLSAPFSLERFVESVMEQPLDRRRPLWEMWVVEGLPNDRWAIVAKVHHCMVDGIAGTDLLAAMTDREPTVDHPASGEWTPAAEPTALEVLRFNVRATVQAAWSHTCRLLDGLCPPTPELPPFAPIAARGTLPVASAEASDIPAHGTNRTSPRVEVDRYLAR